MLIDYVCIMWLVIIAYSSISVSTFQLAFWKSYTCRGHKTLQIWRLVNAKFMGHNNQNPISSLSWVLLLFRIWIVS